MILELACLAFFTARIFHSMYFQESTVFWKDTKNYMVLGTILVSVVSVFSAKIFLMCTVIVCELIKSMGFWYSIFAMYYECLSLKDQRIFSFLS